MPVITVDSHGRTATIVGSTFAGDGGGGEDVGILLSWNGSKWVPQQAEGLNNPTGTSWGYTAVDTDSRGGRWAVGHAPGGEGSLVAYVCRPAGT